VNQRLPSGPVVMPLATSVAGKENSVILPLGVMRPMVLPASVNHRFPSGPAAISPEPDRTVGKANVVITPSGVTRPIVSAASYHKLPSGPVVILNASLSLVANSVTLPVGVIRPMEMLVVGRPLGARIACCSMNHRLPSGPPVIPPGPDIVPGNWNSVNTPAGVMRPILLASKRPSVNHRFPSGPVVIPRGALLGVGIRYSVMPTASRHRSSKGSRCKELCRRDIEQLGRFAGKWRGISRL